MKFLDISYRGCNRVRRELIQARAKFNEHRRTKLLASLRNIHAGRDAVIVGMGPSLRIEDLERLRNMVSFACNKIYLSFDKTKWRPDYYSICDVLVAQNNAEAIMSADFGDALPVHSEVVWPVLKRQSCATYYKYNGSIAHWQPSQAALLPKDLADGVLAYGCTVVIDQIQLAYAMGFRRVFLIGIDFSFSGGLATGIGSVSGEVLISEGERNHFHPDYRKSGETWTVPKMTEMAHAYAWCRAGFESAGRELYNASRVSSLDVLERVAFDEVFPNE